MSQITASQAETRTPPPGVAAPVDGSFNYLVPGDVKPAIHIAPPGEGETDRSGTFSAEEMPVADIRGLPEEATLDRQGFALVPHDTAVKDFYDEDEVRAVYFPEIERLIKETTGASKVIIFDHTIRVEGGDAVNDRGLRKPVRVVHNDYTEKSGPQRVRDLVEDPAEAEARLQKRFAVVNIWRPIRGPVQTVPLGIIDAESVAPDDLIATDLVYTDRTGEIYQIAHNPKHRWHYISQMQRDEAMLIKSYDSATDGRARFTPHSAFHDPTAPEGAAPRESIEVRTLIFFDPEPRQ